MSEAITSFTTVVPSWRPRITPLDTHEASSEQLEAMKVTTSNVKIGEFIRVLALDPETLLNLTPLLNGIISSPDGLSRAETELGAVSASLVNRSIYCAAAHSHQYNQLTDDDSLMDDIFSRGDSTDLSSRQNALWQFAANLSQCPPVGTAVDLTRLLENGLKLDEILDLILSASLFGWVNRLSQVLGDPV